MKSERILYLASTDIPGELKIIRDIFNLVTSTDTDSILIEKLNNLLKQNYKLKILSDSIIIVKQKNIDWIKIKRNQPIKTNQLF